MSRVEIKIGTVAHGYQLEIINYVRSTDSGSGVERTVGCHDFAGNYDQGLICDAINLAIIKAMKNLEKDYLKSPLLPLHGELEQELGHSISESQVRTLLAEFRTRGVATWVKTESLRRRIQTILSQTHEPTN